MRLFKVVVTLSLTFLVSIVCLTACGTKSETEKSSVPSSNSGSATQGAVTDTIISEEEATDERNSDNKPVTVVDETGKKCTLKLDRNCINFEDVGTIFSKCSIGDIVWNGVYKSDFYYVRLIERYNKSEDYSNRYNLIYHRVYTIYKNQGEQVASFELPEWSGGFNLKNFICVCMMGISIF